MAAINDIKGSDIDSFPELFEHLMIILNDYELDKKMTNNSSSMDIDEKTTPNNALFVKSIEVYNYIMSNKDELKAACGTEFEEKIVDYFNEFPTLFIKYLDNYAAKIKNNTSTKYDNGIFVHKNHPIFTSLL
jgi:hypothetical protein